jgi:hypothetical protein
VPARGWTVGRIDYIDAPSFYEGLGIEVTQTMEHQQRDDPKNPNPDKILEMALGTAGVRISGHGGQGPNVTQESLTIFIGDRIRDSYRITPPDSDF